MSSSGEDRILDTIDALLAEEGPGPMFRAIAGYINKAEDAELARVVSYLTESGGDPTDANSLAIAIRALKSGAHRR